LDLFDIALEEYLDPEVLSLLEGAFGELIARDARWKTKVVFDA